METIEKTIEVEAPVSKVYNQWTLTGPVAWAIALPTHRITDHASRSRHHLCLSGPFALLNKLLKRISITIIG